MDLQFRLGVREGYCTSTTPVSMSRSRRGQKGTRSQQVANGADPGVVFISLPKIAYRTRAMTVTALADVERGCAEMLLESTAMVIGTIY